MSKSVISFLAGKTYYNHEELDQRVKGTPKELTYPRKYGVMWSTRDAIEIAGSVLITCLANLIYIYYILHGNVMAGVIPWAMCYETTEVVTL